MNKKDDSFMTKLLTMLWELLGLGFTYVDKEVVVDACKVYPSILDSKNIRYAIESHNNGNESKFNLLHDACRDENFELVKMLLKLGLNPNVATFYYSTTRQTSLITAITFGRTKIVELLLEAGADSQSYYDSSFNWTLLHVASIHGYDGIVNLLIKHGVDSNPQATGSIYGGMTPLHIAYKCNKVDTIKVLLQNGANPDILDKDGKRPIDYARNPEIIKLLSSREKSSSLPKYDDLDPPAYGKDITLDSIQVGPNPPSYEVACNS